MPELPEVESLRLGLGRKIVGQKIKSVKILNGKIVSSNSNCRKINPNKIREFSENLANKKIVKLKRIAKNLILELEDKSLIIIHLKMTGQLVFQDWQNKKTIGGHPILESYKLNLPNKHTHLIFSLNQGKLFYNDIRKFGYVLYYRTMAEALKAGHFKNLGPDPFAKNFTKKYLGENLKKKNKSLKTVLLEQKVVSGCGNIYSDEICHAAQINPRRQAKSLNPREVKFLYQNIKKIFRQAIKAGGSSVSNYLLADGSKGNYAKRHKVYQKAGEICQTRKCKKHKNKIQRTIHAGRSTFFCAFCQK